MSFIQTMTGGGIRHVEPVRKARASGLVREVYAALEREFALVPPLTILSPSPAILAGAWVATREVFIVDPAHRAAREVVASGVSLANACPYCVEVHSAMLDGSGQHDVADEIRSAASGATGNALLDWARASRQPGDKALAILPFSPDLAPQMLGTAVLFHFINRMVSVFVADSPAPVPLRSSPVRKLFGRAFGGTVGKHLLRVEARPGEALALLPPASLPPQFAWAAGNPVIAAALARFNAAVEAEGQRLVPARVRELLELRLAQWRGEAMPLGSGWLYSAMVKIVDPDEVVSAELVLLTAFAPFTVSGAVIARFRDHHADDEVLIATCAWASLATTRRIVSWLAPHG
jgi:AhpD family alkylhydroperoxidase